MVASARASAAFRTTLPSFATTYELDAFSFIYSSRTLTMRLFFSQRLLAARVQKSSLIAPWKLPARNLHLPIYPPRRAVTVAAPVLSAREISPVQVLPLDHGQQRLFYTALQQSSGSFQSRIAILICLFQGKHRSFSVSDHFARVSLLDIEYTHPAPVLSHKWQFQWKGQRPVLAYAAREKSLAKTEIPPSVFWKGCHIWDSRARTHETRNRT